MSMLINVARSLSRPNSINPCVCTKYTHGFTIPGVTLRKIDTKKGMH